MNKKSSWVGRRVVLDLGQIGPAELTIIGEKDNKLILKYQSTGKVIELDRKTVQDQVDWKF